MSEPVPRILLEPRRMERNYREEPVRRSVPDDDGVSKIALNKDRDVPVSEYSHFLRF